MDIIDVPNKEKAIKEFIESEDSDNVRGLLTLLYKGLSVEDIYMSIYKFSCIVRPRSETHTSLIACVKSLGHSEVLAHAMEVDCELLNKNISNLHEFEYLMMINSYGDNRKYIDMLLDKFINYDIYTTENPYDLMQYVTDLYGLSEENVLTNIANNYANKDFVSCFFLFVRDMHRRATKYGLKDIDYKNISIIEKYNECYIKFRDKFNMPVNKLLTIKSIIPITLLHNTIVHPSNLFTLVSDAYKLEKYGVNETYFTFTTIAITRLLKTLLSASRSELSNGIESLSNTMGKLLYEDFIVCHNNSHHVYTKNMVIEEYYKRYTHFNDLVENPYDKLASYLGDRIATRLCHLLNRNRIMYANIFDVEQLMHPVQKVKAIILCKHEQVINVINIFVQVIDMNCSVVKNSIIFNNILDISFYSPGETEFLHTINSAWMRCYYDGEQIKAHPSYITYLLTGVSFESTPSNIHTHISEDKAYVIPKYFRDVKYKQESYLSIR